MQVDVSSFQLEAARQFINNFLPGIRAAVTGSLGLVMHGFDLERECSDIDIICESVPDPLPEGWIEKELPPPFTAKLYEAKTSMFKYTFDVHLIVWEGFESINIQGIEVGTFEDIIDAKLDFGMTGTKKHLQDFHKIIIQLYHGRKQ